MKKTGSTGDDVIDLLQDEDSEIDRLFHEFFTDRARDELRRSVIGKELVDRLSMHDAANEVIARTLLLDVGRADLAEELGRHSRRYRRLVGELDDISAGVSPRDIRGTDGRRFDGLITQLRDLRREQVGVEVQQVIPTIRHSISQRRREELAGEIGRVRRLATTRPGPDRRPPPRMKPSPGALTRPIRRTIGRLRSVGRVHHPHTE